MAQSALLGHCQTVYAAMEDEAYLQEIETGAEVLIWEGFLTELWVGLGKSKGSPTYSAVVRTLQAMGSATQLQRGARSTPSRWALFYQPTPALWRQYLETHPDAANGSIGSSSRVSQYTAMLHADLRVATRKINELEGKVLQLEQTCGILLHAHNTNNERGQ